MSRQSEWIDAFAGVKLVVFGDVMLDRYTFGDCNRISPEAPAPVFLAQRVEEMVGGAGNVARNIASLGGQAALIGAIGHDSAGLALIAAADDTPGLTPHLARTDAARTAVKNRFVAKNQQMLRVDEEDIVELPETTVEALFAHLDTQLEGAAALILSDYAKGVLSRPTIARAAAMARARGLPVIIDPKSRDLARYRRPRRAKYSTSPVPAIPSLQPWPWRWPVTPRSRSPPNWPIALPALSSARSAPPR